MSEKAIIITAAFTFLGTLVVSIRMVIAWHFKHKIKIIEAMQRKDLYVLETEKSNSEKAIQNLEQVFADFKLELEAFKVELKKTVEKYSENQQKQAQLMKTVHEYMVRNETKWKDLDAKIGKVVVK